MEKNKEMKIALLTIYSYNYLEIAMKNKKINLRNIKCCNNKYNKVIIYEPNYITAKNENEIIDLYIYYLLK